MDRLSPLHRSWNMSRIKAKDTLPELTVRSLIHSLGFRFRLHCSNLPGKPDIILPRLKTAIFVHGCFWHRHLGCHFAYTPKTREEFWNKKFRNTKLRDQYVATEIRKLGWINLTVWECELKDIEGLKKRIRNELAVIENNSGIK